MENKSNRIIFIIWNKLQFDCSNCATICLLLFIEFLLGITVVNGQLMVSINQSGNTANSCLRTLTAQVQNGSGNYSYSWSLSTPGIPFPGPNNLQVVQAGINQSTTFTVFVTDNGSSNTTSDSETVYRVLLGNFDTFIPNAFTPNSDGYNDIWIVADGNQGFGAINAYSYNLTIRTLSNTVLYQTSGTVSSGHLGLFGGDISWNGRINGTGSIVAVGTYKYSLSLQNCSYNSAFNGNIDVLY